MKIMLIDDEPNSPYMQNVYDLLSVKHSVECMPDIQKARAEIDNVLQAEIVVADLMMPETDISKEIPQDTCTVGVDYCEKLVDRGYSGLLVILTNANRERHRSEMHRLQTILSKCDRNYGPISKLQVSPIKFVDTVLDKK